jgi:protocatechuate 3,4-dioxygenase beta subunit
MTIARRGFIAAGGAWVGCALGGVASADEGAPRKIGYPITKPELDAQIHDLFGGRLTCVRTPESAEGPFYSESSPERRQIAEGHPGARLRLGIYVAGLGGFGPDKRCPALRGAIVDIWHTDASALYSNVGGDLQTLDTIGQTFCRGHQIADENGLVEFDTIVPGWELAPAPVPAGALARATHIHVKVFKGHTVATTQLYLPDKLLDDLYSNVNPYADHRSLTAPGLTRSYERVRNADDRLFVMDRSTPMSVRQKGGVWNATAIIGLAALTSEGTSPLWR